MSVTVLVFEAGQKHASWLLIRTMKHIGMKKKTERKMIKNSFGKKPAKIPGLVKRRVTIVTAECLGRQYWMFFPLIVNMVP